MPLQNRCHAGLATSLLLLGSACASSAGMPGDLQIHTTSPAQLLAGAQSAGDGFPAACKAWTLSPSQARQFFALATEQSPQDQHRFDYLPCEITGELQADGQRWQFRINAAGTGSWQHNGIQRHVACTQPACEPLVLMLPEPGDP